MPSTRADIARYLSDKITESFTENLKKQRKEEYKEFFTPKKSTKDEEIYASIGNLLAAEEKVEGGALHYDTLTEMYFTTVINKTYDRGFSATWEEVEDDPDKIIQKARTGGMIRAMISKREKLAAAVVDGVFTSTSADGKVYAANDHPLDTTKTALVNDNLMTASAITPDNVITGCNMFNTIYDYAGNLLDTSATAILAHSNKQATVNAVLMSNLKASELSNTKNTVPMLKAKFGRYINANYWHLMDENIDSFIMQRRTGLVPFSDQDKISTLNFYWAMVERYRMAQINPGYGHVSNAYAG
jgi:phage major head subunit gpT-like protein